MSLKYSGEHSYIPRHLRKGQAHMGIATMIGASIKRREDPRLITGQATYVDDIKLIGMLHMTVLRSPYGHAFITSIETEAARKHPGVVAVYTAENPEGKVG